MDKKITVYIASPYTVGDTALNVKAQMITADELMNEGLIPFVPLYSHFQHMMYPRPYEEWLDMDKQWVLRCDCLLRLEGESKGADIEVAFALEHGIHVFHSIEEITNWYEVGIR